tara:strand:+ start:397 stop:2058 length:1662 start_codon:yes stop_codon:yes gene_type:complete
VESNLTINKPKLNVTNIKSLLAGSGSVLGNVGQEGTSNAGTLARIVRKNRILINSLVKSQETQDRKITIIKNIIQTQKQNIGQTDRGNIENTLVETNKILVEIQKQLALDFAMRAREEKEERDTIRRDESRKKLKAEESLLEKSARKLGKGIKKTTGKIISPIKNVFDQILEFLTLVGAGIAANAAFEWLKDPENRKQLDEWFGWVADNWQWVAGITAGVLLLEPILSLVGAIGGAIVTIKSGFDLFNLIRKRLFGGAKTPPAGGKPAAGGKPTLTVGDPGKATGQRGGFRDPGRYRKPGQTRAGSSFQSEKARKALTQSGGNLTPKGNIFSKLNKIKIGKTNLALIGLQLTDYFMPKISGGKFEDLSDIVESGIAKLGIGVKTYSDEKLLKEYKTLREDYDKGMAALIANPVPGIDPMTVIGSFEDYDFGRGRSLVREVERRGLSIEPRAMGGPITAGKPYLVGEGGPELVVPKISGTVINNMKTEQIYQMISSDIGEGKINMIELPSITNQLPPPEIPVPSGPATEVPEVSSVNLADPYRQLTPMLYGITV